MALAIGDRAPGFELTRRIGEAPIRLSDYQGEKPVVILFFPLAFSSTCTEELCTIAENYAQWSELNAEVVGISVDSPFVNQRFAEECGAEFPILSDFNKDASTAYGVNNENFYGMSGVSDRSVFVVDREGKIVYIWISEDAGVFPPLDEVMAVVKGLN